jgi:single-strand DNA-binding protein
MSETLVTLVGNVATQPELKQTSSGVPVVRFRLASTERRYDRAAERWTDGHTSFYTVWTWRSLAENVSGSVGIGEPVIVQGRLRVHEREENGQSFLSASVDAVAVGHDLTRGTSAFRRMFKPRTEWTDRLPGAPGPVAVDPRRPAGESLSPAAVVGDSASGPPAADPLAPELVPS